MGRGHGKRGSHLITGEGSVHTGQALMAGEQLRHTAPKAFPSL